MAKTHSFYENIHNLRERFNKESLQKQALLVMIEEAEVFDHVYNSNAIENSTLTLEETEKILLQIDLDRYITERELFEAKNLARVVTYIRENAPQSVLSLDMMQFLHNMLIVNIRDDIAGRFRKPDEWVRVGSHIAPDPTLVSGLLEEMLLAYHKDPAVSVISRIARLHLTFEQIHPFVDGNGRMGRVIINYLLIREGYVPININFSDRSRYYDAFNEFNSSGKPRIMEELVGKALSVSYHKRLAYLEGRRIIRLRDYAREQSLSHSNLINKAHRQTIEAFLEKGIWKIGVESGF